MTDIVERLEDTADAAANEIERLRRQIERLRARLRLWQAGTERLLDKVSDADWRPIATAPRDGTRILAAWPDSRVTIAWWWTNPRLEEFQGHPLHVEGWAESHFIDHDEMDDYEISKPENQPTHWLPLPELPVKKP